MGDVDRERQALYARLTAHREAKLAVWLGLAVGICVPYFGLQYVDVAPIRSVPATRLDALVPFTPAFVWIYLSLGALVPLAPALADSRDALARYARGLAMLCVPCFLAFALWPVEGPRPERVPGDLAYRWLVSVDRPSNSMPSLHAGLTVYSLLFARRVLAEHARGRVGALGLLWGTLILYSTLATKQHWFWDLPAGALLAWLAFRWSWRGAGSPAGR